MTMADGPKVTMSVEQYLEIMRVIGTQGQGIVQGVRDATSAAKKLVKRKGSPNPKMARALKKANSQLRTKSGKLRKGVSQGDVMRRAHALRRKM
jgi:hypothetical protein